jgi:hypothetical protein
LNIDPEQRILHAIDAALNPHDHVTLHELVDVRRDLRLLNVQLIADIIILQGNVDLTMVGERLDDVSILP